MATLSTKPWAPKTNPPKINFLDARIVDVKHGRILEHCDLILNNGKVVAVGPNTGNLDHYHSYRSDEITINLDNRYYLCPGLIDCHVHLTANAGQSSMRDLFAAHPNTIAYRTAWNAKQMLLRGFTTVRDTGGADAALREAIAEGLVLGPRLFIAGKALSQTGGHGDLRLAHQGNEYKCCGGSMPGFARVCDGVPACLEAARDELRQGADFLKIMVGGGVASPSDPLDMLQFTAEEIQAITTTARQMGKYVTAHAYTAEAIRHAVDNGVLGIEHGNFIDAETATLCAEKGVSITPTLVTYKAMSEPPYEDFLLPEGRVKNARVLNSGVEALKTLYIAGANVCFGTDLLAGMHRQQSRELEIRSTALPAAEILKQATVNAARLLRCEKTLGQLSIGYSADVLILADNPLNDITYLHNMEKAGCGIIKEGRVVASTLKGLEVDPLYR